MPSEEWFKYILQMGYLNFVIALLFVFLLFSLFTSWIVEFYVQKKNIRGTFLEEKLSKVLNTSHNDWLKKVYEHPALASLIREGRTPSQIDPKLFAKAAASLYEKSSIRGRRGGLPELLHSIIGEDDNIKVDEIEKSIENWFITFNGRVAYWYKEQTRTFLFVAGLGLAVIANVDLVTISKTLWEDSNLTAEVAQSAETFMKNNKDLNPATQEQLAQIAWDYHESKKLPVGWDFTGGTCCCNVTFYKVISKIVGFLLSAFAVTLGAPFWFDALKKVLSLKSSKR